MLSRPNILVCTDFSSFSDEAIRAAEILKRKCNGNLHILHVSESTVMWDWMPKEGIPSNVSGNYEMELLTVLRKKLHSQIAVCGASGEGHVALGIVSSVIAQETLDKKIDLIVMGHKGQTGGHFHFGGNVEKIMATATVPVLVIKKPLALEKVAALVDPNGQMKKIISWSEELSLLLSAKLNVVSLFPDIAARYIGVGKWGFSTELLSLTDEQKETVISEVKDKLKKNLTKYLDATLLVEVSIEKRLAYHLATILMENKIDLAVMQRHQSDFMEKLLIGSETRRMTELYPGNLFILPP